MGAHAMADEPGGLLLPAVRTSVAESARSAGAGLLARVVGFLPRGGLLPDERWHVRHRHLLVLLWLHAAAMVVIAVAVGLPLEHGFEEGALLGAPAVAAGWPRLSKRVRSSLVAGGLIGSSAVLVHLTGGLIEAHFHFFVVVALLSLYQDWLPFGLAVVLTVLHHGIIGTLEPHSVYNHQAATTHPWLWAGIHGVALLAASWAGLFAWRLNEQQALRDGLTGLATGRLLTERANAALGRRGNGVVGIVYIDLDGFKSVNDSFGHPAADGLLAEVARRLGANVRSCDTVARIGGDEFAVLLDVLPSEEFAVAVAARLRRALSEPYDIGGRPVSVSGSVGLATTEQSDPDVDALLFDADLAMYAAKSSGPAELRVFERNMHEALSERARLEGELRAALDGGQFVLHYQPVVELCSARTVAAEALVRWRHPARGILGPAEFLTALQDAGLMPRLTAWVLAEACRWVRGHHDAHPGAPALSVAVNISPRDLVEPGLLNTVAAALADAGLDGRFLCIEVTETALLEDLAASRSVLAALRRLGVQVALDDFGTGYSSLTHLRSLPLDVVKIDRSFVAGLGVEPADTAVVAAVVELATTLGLTVVAEGVETAGQAAVLRGLGCPQGQGYAFSRPVPGSEFDAPAQLLAG